MARLTPPLDRIPPPAEVQSRLFESRREQALLRRLLDLAERVHSPAADRNTDSKRAQGDSAAGRGAFDARNESQS